MSGFGNLTGLGFQIIFPRSIVAQNIKTITPEFKRFLDSAMEMAAKSPREDFKQMSKHLEWVERLIDPAVDDICIGKNTDVSEFVRKMPNASKEEIQSFLTINNDRFGDVFLDRFENYIGGVSNRMPHRE